MILLNILLLYFRMVLYMLTVLYTFVLVIRWIWCSDVWLCKCTQLSAYQIRLAFLLFTESSLHDGSNVHLVETCRIYCRLVVLDHLLLVRWGILKGFMSIFRASIKMNDTFIKDKFLQRWIQLFADMAEFCLTVRHSHGWSIFL